MGSRRKFIDFVVDWCSDDSHGYSQVNRWGPDCDCSSLMYMAGVAAGYDLPTSGTRYTGTMVRHFQAAGWRAVPFDGNLYDCSPGCIALNVANHTEAFVDWGVLGGAHIDEHGGVQGCCQGDQTGNEVSVGSAYIPSYGWDYILIPPDDGDAEAPSETVDVPMPRYRVKAGGRWLSWLTGLSCDCPCGDDYAGNLGTGIEDVEFDPASLGPSGWYQLNTDHGKLGRNERNGSGKVIGVTVYYDTPEPGKTGYRQAYYRVHVLGGSWLKWEIDDRDNGAGDSRNVIDGLQVSLTNS